MQPNDTPKTLSSDKLDCMLSSAILNVTMACPEMEHNQGGTPGFSTYSSLFLSPWD